MPGLMLMLPNNRFMSCVSSCPATSTANSIGSGKTPLAERFQPNGPADDLFPDVGSADQIVGELDCLLEANAAGRRLRFVLRAGQVVHGRQTLAAEIEGWWMVRHGKITPGPGLGLREEIVYPAPNASGSACLATMEHG